MIHRGDKPKRKKPAGSGRKERDPLVRVRYVAGRMKGKSKTQAMLEAKPHLRTRKSASVEAAKIEKDPKTIALLESETAKWARISYAARDMVGQKLAPEAFPVKRGVANPLTVAKAIEHALDASWLKVGGLMKDRIEITNVGRDDLKGLSLDELEAMRKRLEAEAEGESNGNTGAEGRHP